MLKDLKSTLLLVFHNSINLRQKDIFLVKTKADVEEQKQNKIFSHFHFSER